MQKFEKLQNTPEDETIEQVPQQEQSDAETKLNPDTIAETLQQQETETQEAMSEINETLPDIEGLLTEVEPGEIKTNAQEQLGGVLSTLGQKLRDSKLAKAAVLAIGLMGPSTAFAGGNLKELDLAKIPTVSAKIHNKQLLKRNEQLLKRQHDYNSLTSVLKAIDSSKKIQLNNVNNQIPKHYEMRNGRLELVDAQGKTIHTNLTQPQLNELANPYNNLKQRKTLPGVTVNGEPVYEIAPGVYGNKHSQYGDGVEIGTINLGN